MLPFSLWDQAEVRVSVKVRGASKYRAEPFVPRLIPTHHHQRTFINLTRHILQLQVNYVVFFTPLIGIKRSPGKGLDLGVTFVDRVRRIIYLKLQGSVGGH